MPSEFYVNGDANLKDYNVMETSFKSVMGVWVLELSQELVLSRYFLHKVGFNDFEELSERFTKVKDSYGESGRSHFFDVLASSENVEVCYDRLHAADDAIRVYVERLARNRGECINLKYFQYFAVLFTELFLDWYFNERGSFLADLNSFVDSLNSQYLGEKFAHFKEDELRKLAFWMATGSGKTIIMHINYWQFLKYAPEKPDNVILVTPNEGLSSQHQKEMRRDGIPCIIHSGKEVTPVLEEDSVRIIDIYKLTEDRKGKKLVRVDEFEGNNLVFIDEGHKGQQTTKTWKGLREQLGETGFIFEYSATFGQVIGHTDLDLIEEYSKAIIIDYSCRRFYTDGYGKDFYLYNIGERSSLQSYQETVLTRNLLSFYEQVLLYERHKRDLNAYQIEKPLWALIGSKVKGAGLNSDVADVVKFLRSVIDEPKWFERNIGAILKAEPQERGIFESKFQWIEKHGYTVSDIYEKVFSSTKGPLRLYELKSDEGEIGLRMGNGEYFGVINIGDVSGFKKVLREAGIEVNEDAITSSLFDRVNERESRLTVIIGAKKFIEGWDSWWVCSMGLLNVGRSAGPQIIQLFGRGVRLRGRVPL